MKRKFNCKHCGIEFEDDSGHLNRQFCSNKCKYLGIGKKISQSKLGHEVSAETRKKVGDFFRGKTYEEIMGKEKAKKLKKSKSFRMSGNKNPFWIDGQKLEYNSKRFNLDFKNAIRKRDNQVCMNCGMHREKMKRALDVHHIDYDETNTIQENCISLCRKCHGLTTFNREYWITLFQKKLSESYKYEYSDNMEAIIHV